MKFGLFNSLLVLIVFWSLIGCDDTTCLESNKLNPDREVILYPVITLFENDTILITIPEYFTPDGDALYDLFYISFYEKNGTQLNSLNYKEATLIISDNCNEIYNIFYI